MSRAPATTRSSRGGGEGGSAGEGGAGPGDGDPGRSHAASGSADPPPAETGAGDLSRWVSDGLMRAESSTGGQTGDEDEETMNDCRAAAALLLRPWIRGDDAAEAIAALTGWIPDHVRHHLARGRGRPVSWQWRLMTVAWVQWNSAGFTCSSAPTDRPLSPTLKRWVSSPRRISRSHSLDEQPGALRQHWGSTSPA